MAGVRALLSRVSRLERSKVPTESLFEMTYGSLEAWEAECQCGIYEGRLDPTDMPIVVMAIRRWHTEGVWR